MKSFLTWIGAAALAAAPLAAQAARTPAPPAQTGANVAAAHELLALAQERAAAGDTATAQLLAERAAQLMSGATASGGRSTAAGREWVTRVAPPAVVVGTELLELRGLGYAAPSESDGSVYFQLAEEPAEHPEFAIEWSEGQRLYNLADQFELTAQAGAQGEGEVMAALREIRGELAAMRAELVSLRAEMAQARGGMHFFPGMIPLGAGGGAALALPGAPMAPPAYGFVPSVPAVPGTPGVLAPPHGAWAPGAGELPHGAYRIVSPDGADAYAIVEMAPKAGAQPRSGVYFVGPDGVDAELEAQRAELESARALIAELQRRLETAGPPAPRAPGGGSR